MIVVLSFTEAILAAIAVLIICMWAGIAITTWWEQSRCSHTSGVNETQACNAICKSCHKNLGFIGTEENKVRRGQ